MLNLSDRKCFAPGPGKGTIAITSFQKSNCATFWQYLANLDYAIVAATLVAIATTFVAILHVTTHHHLN